MIVRFLDKAYADYLHWQKVDVRKFKKIQQLLKNCQETPYDGIGKPEPLKHELSGHWSRRIDQKNRLIYRIQDHEIIVIICRLHYPPL